MWMSTNDCDLDDSDQLSLQPALLLIGDLWEKNVTDEGKTYSVDSSVAEDVEYYKQTGNCKWELDASGSTVLARVALSLWLALLLLFE